MREFHRIIVEQADHMRGPHRRPARCGAHQLGHAVGSARALGGGRAGGAGEDLVVDDDPRKLRDDAERPSYVLNEHGVGYRMHDP
ncbi:MAG: hypothetical protein OXE53_15340 [Deltaproteobacteria bacterium]|nr:hypothetical protein [Deltaproteobacteria bacterium]